LFATLGRLIVQAASDRKTTVFVSYRREGGFVLAKYIFDHLHAAGYDVFMDVHSLGAGEFEQTTLAQVAARDYFLLVLTSGSLKGMTRENDWLRKELMQAIEFRRTVVPVLAEDFKFEDHRVQEVLKKLPRALQSLSSFNAVRIPPPEYFDSAMERLRRFLKATREAAPSHGTGKSSGAAGARKSVAQAQSALHGLTLPPVNSLTKAQSATPWSDLQATLAGRGVVGVNAPTLKKPVAPTRLPAPTLTKGLLGGLSWTEVSKADTYVLEESYDAKFENPGKAVYQGSITFWMNWLSSRPSGPIDSILKPPSRYYRVKAIGKGRTGESDWSNIVTIVTAKPVAPTRLPAPTLTKGLLGGLSWTEVSKADTYVLEESYDAKFENPGKAVYQGSKRFWMNWLSSRPSGPIDSILKPPSRYYRVKAIGKGRTGESDWSNIVRDPP
jgi:TIR domain